MKYWLYVLCLSCLPAYAGELKSSQSKEIAEQLVRTINEKIAEITALELAEGVPIKDIEINLSQAKRFDTGRFGAILDANVTGRVVSVTPRSQAYELGLQSGDIIKKINDKAFSEAAKTGFKELQYLKRDTSVVMKVDRLGDVITLSATLKARYIPQWQLNSTEWIDDVTDNIQFAHIPYWDQDLNSPIFSSAQERLASSSNFDNDCGQIIVVNSVSIAPPRYSGLKTTTVIKSLNDQPWIKDGSRTRVSVGKHQLRIGNKYDLPKEFKDYTVNVRANTNYYIAYTRNQSWVDDSGKALELGKYTGPVIWKTTQQSCEK
ncbi:hypothetical protein ACFSJY_15900 [Thalassotalea euphylliae]|uniref:hypothetical protein n=1 Tax=Thalassotalea euphylliae TaxID=1655234 RepID=UPI003626C256